MLTLFELGSAFCLAMASMFKYFIVDCFEVKNDDNGTTNLTVSNSTKHFFKLLNESQNCFSSHIQVHSFYLT